MRITLPNGKWRKRLKIKALPPFAELHKVRAGNYKIFTANIINERNPVCYGADRRWANHLYPIYVTESYVKSKYLGESMFLNLF